VGAGVGTDVLGEPLEALAWLATTLARRGLVLRAGEVVLLGSLVRTHWIERGDDVVIENDQLGSARLRLS
jgi:2-keto-4-pentenoate hydratase